MGPIPEFRWVEILAPILCILFIIEILSKRQSFLSKRSSLFLIAITVLFLWAIVDYIKSPVSAEKLFGASYTEAGLRSYYTIFIGITTFFCSFWFFRYKKLKVNRWFVYLIFFSLLFGYLRFIGYFNNFYVPFLGGDFRDVGENLSFYRIFGLDDIAILGVPLILSLFYKRKWNIFAIFCFASYLGFVIISGGRSYFFGILLALIIYIILIDKKLFLWSSIASLTFILLYKLINFFIPLTNQLNRLFAIKGGFLQQDLYRYHTFIYYWEIFREYPIFGKGIGYLKNITISDSNYADFISDQIMRGGHNSYLSILCIFGIGGIFFLTVTLFGSIYYSYRIFKKDIDFQNNVKLALFAFLYLIILSIVFIPGWSGYESMELWFISGMVAGINAKDDLRNVKL
ncbi:MAG: O-antigen ligase family protein [Candidatus Helarchaeota archaeon]